MQFVKGSDFVLEGGDSSLRLAYSGVTPEQIEEGVRRLAEAYAEIGAATPAVGRRAAEYHVPSAARALLRGVVERDRRDGGADGSSPSATSTCSPSAASARSIAAVAITCMSKDGLWQGLRTIPTSRPSRVTVAPYSGTSSPSIRSVVSRRAEPSSAILRSASRPEKSLDLSSLTTLSSLTSNGSVL